MIENNRENLISGHDATALNCTVIIRTEKQSRSSLLHTILLGQVHDCQLNHHHHHHHHNSRDPVPSCCLFSKSESAHSFSLLPIPPLVHIADLFVHIRSLGLLAQLHTLATSRELSNNIVAIQVSACFFSCHAENTYLVKVLAFSAS